MTIGSLWRIPSRWFGVSMNPPVPMNPPSENFSRPASRAFDVTSITVSSGTLALSSFPGSTSTWYALMRSPHIGTLATPGIRSRRARIFQ